MGKDTRHIEAVTGGFTMLDGEPYYRISAYDHMAPFLMSIASDADLWMFISSAGGLTAGRVDANGSLFPYETVDKLHDGHHHTGPVTMLRVTRGEAVQTLWQPFLAPQTQAFRVERNLYKNVIGNRLVFEEINHDLELAFRYRWAACDELGLVRTAALSNRGSNSVAVSMLDGLRNVLPYGAPLALYQQLSSLVDAYKRVDCDPDTRLAVYSLTAAIVDRPEAAEVLRANTVWCYGLDELDVCLSEDALDAFRRGEPVSGDRILTGRRGNYLAAATLKLAAGTSRTWHTVADVGLSHTRLAALRQRLLSDSDLDAEVENSLALASENLQRTVASADGLQLTGQREACVHHFANVLFNNMRGGVFADNNAVSSRDLRSFVRSRNRTVGNRCGDTLDGLSENILVDELHAVAQETQDADLERLCHEYLPLYFGRRHGDPSRPWNAFAIRVKNADGSRALEYQGNWRDIFQNWEALCISFPWFLPSIVAKFVNASTVDGFNPYRITHEGIDWEIEDADDPWSHIGYWGDHQIIYLLKLLEALDHHLPWELEDRLTREIFCYADVPYRIQPYADILADPHTTIVYDHELAARIDDRVASIGADGKLFTAPDGSVYHVNLIEKLLVPALSKLSNFIPDAGIWMNTQRPEWNDANNALVGNGVSMVTLCYLRRYLAFLVTLLEKCGELSAPVSTEVVDWFDEICSVLDASRDLIDSAAISDLDRKHFLDGVGEAFSKYRETVYAHGFSGRKEMTAARIVAFCRVALEHIDRTIHSNRRDDGLYHSYNLVEASSRGTELSVTRLYEMLEGQVAVLSAGLVDAPEAVRILSGLFDSRMYGENRRSFLLYPERTLPEFVARNRIPEEKVRDVALLQELLAAGDHSVVQMDVFGIYRFNGDFTNGDDLNTALDRLAQHDRWKSLVTSDRQATLGVFEDVFNHRLFTGRSGTMYGYEGLGCIYWHMVAKLLVAVQEIVHEAARNGSPGAVLTELARMYYRVRAGLGFEKTVAEYGAFPTDPYSHTPSHAGAQQPGMTGQVKEEIITRFGELGVEVRGCQLNFHPVLLRPDEFMQEPGTYSYFDFGGEPRSIEVPSGALAFSLCQVPIVYEISARPWMRVTSHGDAVEMFDGHRLNRPKSLLVLKRAGIISRIDVGIPEKLLCRI